MHVAHFVHRYPPALGGSEAYFARLSEYLAGARRRRDRLDDDGARAGGVLAKRGPRDSRRAGSVSRGSAPPLASSRLLSVRRYRPLALPRPPLPPQSRCRSFPHRRWQCLTLPCNPVCPGMWRDAGRYAGPLDAVHATAFPYAFPIAVRPAAGPAARRAVPAHAVPAPRRPDDPHDRTRRQYTAAAPAVAAAAGRSRVRADAAPSATRSSTSACRTSASCCKGWASIRPNAPAATATRPGARGACRRTKSSSATWRTTASRRGRSIC